MGKKYVFDLDEVEASTKTALLDSGVGKNLNVDGAAGAQARLQMAVVPAYARATADERNRGTGHADVALAIAAVAKTMVDSYIADRCNSPDARDLIASAFEFVWTHEPDHKRQHAIRGHARQ